MGLNVKWVHGALIYHDGQRWFDAFGEKVSKFVGDFIGTLFSAADAPDGWSATLVELGAGESTIALQDAAGGQLLITADANEDDGAQMQLTTEAFKLVAGFPCYFGCRFQISEATQSDVLIGLCITDTTLLGGMTDGVYFRKIDGATALKFTLEKNSAESEEAVGTTIVGATWYVVEFYFDGANVDAWVNGVQVARLAQTNLPDDEELTLSIAFLNGAAGAGKTATVDWIRAIQINA